MKLQEFFRLAVQAGKEAEKHHIHVVIAGHISSDTLGLNLLLDVIEQRGPLAVEACSGFKRIRRQS